MKPLLSALLALAAALPAALTGASAHASSAPYPTKPVRIVIPFAPGQGSDILARAIGERLTKAWGQPVVVENRAGANGAIALQDVARSAPDGYTILLTSNSPIVINPSLYKKLPYDVGRDFVPVALLAATDMVMVVTDKFPARNLQEVITELKAHPDKYSYGSPGTGSTSHLSMEVFKRTAGVKITHVPYKGSAPAFTDLIGGSTQLMIDAMPSSLPQVKGGRVRAIAITSSDVPSTIAPDIPTASSAGVAGLPERPWYGVFAPRATDPDIVAKIRTDLLAAMKSPEIHGRMAELGLEAVPPLGAAEFADFLKEHTDYWNQATRKIGMYQTE